MIPQFNDDGLLPPGVHQSTSAEFIDRFCTGTHRERFYPTVTNVFDFAARSGALSVLFGGSFITDKKTPIDMDGVIVFENERDIPQRRESLEIGGTRVDIFFCATKQPEILASFVKLFSQNRFGQAAGCIVIHLRKKGKPLWNVLHESDESTFEIVKRAYVNRHVVERQPREKALITIHGIRSYAEWNAEISLIASVNGWAVAPFHYGYVDVDVFVNRSKRNEIVDKFRAFAFELTHTFDIENISIIAHSFGTYVIVRYLLGFDDPPVQFDSLILCGAIVDHKLDLERFRGRAAMICNEVAPNDEWADWAKTANFGRDEFFGNAATLGFESLSPRLLQRSSDIFTHNNVIKRDVVVQRWMPILEANVGAVRRERHQIKQA